MIAPATSYGEDFIMTPIKCPPPKIVAVTRSLKKKKEYSEAIDKKKNIMDDCENDFVNEEDGNCSSSDDIKDLIEFEKEEPLIDLSEVISTQDTIADMNAKNSNSSTITMLLDLLEIGSIITSASKSETEIMGSCAKDDDYDTFPSLSSTKKSSSSLTVLPLEYPGACANGDTEKTDNSSSIPSLPQPLSAIQPENSSIVKNYLNSLDKIRIFNDKSIINSTNRIDNSIETVREGIDGNFIDLNCLRKNSREEKSSSSIFTSTSKSSRVNESSKFICCCSTVGESCKCNQIDNSTENNEKKDTKFILQKKDKDSHVVQLETKKEESVSDKNNNCESVFNQNITKDDISFNFLSPNTSQRKLPPKFYSSTNSLNRDSCFEASSRLKRLEERFKGFSYTKKLLRSSKVFSKSEEILCSYEKDYKTEFKPFYSESNTSDSLNSSSLLQFPLTTFSTFKGSPLDNSGTENDSSELQQKINNGELFNPFFIILFFYIKKTMMKMFSCLHFPLSSLTHNLCINNH